MSKSERKKQFQPIPISAILDPKYQSPFSKLDNFQVDMDIPGSTLRPEGEPRGMWQKLQTSLLKALSNFVIISHPVLSKAGVASRSSSMSLVPWKTQMSGDLILLQNLDFGDSSDQTKSVPEPKISTIYHSIRNGLECLRYVATTPLHESNLETCKQNSTRRLISGYSSTGGGFLPLIPNTQTSMSAPPSPSHLPRARSTLPNNFFGLAMSGRLVASPRHQYNSFYAHCIYTPDRNKGISARPTPEPAPIPIDSVSATPTSLSSSSSPRVRNFEILVHTTIGKAPSMPLPCSKSSKASNSLPATPLKSNGSGGTMGSPGNTKSSCLRIETNWLTMNSNGSNSGDENNSVKNFHPVTVCSSSTSRLGTSTIHISCSSKTSSPPKAISIPKRFKTESESSTDSFIEFSASVESTDSFCIVFEECSEDEALPNQAGHDDDDWEDEEDTEDESDEDDEEDRVLNYSLTSIEDPFLPEDILLADGVDQVDFLQPNPQEKKKTKKVSFNEEQLAIVLEFEDDEDSKEARETYWETLARDHSRFQDRIQRTGDILQPILMPQHRQQVFLQRFAPKEPAN